ncbi:MAG: HNH endonuclease signature motif containing protein [Patescibacteria group bacterium]
MDKNINELHSKFTEYGRHAKEWQRKCALLLSDVDKFEVWKKKGFESIYEYAAKLAGMNHGQVDESLRIYRKIENKPALLEVAEKKGLYAVKPVATIATEETQEYWAKYAKEMRKHELETFVRDFRNQEMQISDKTSDEQKLKTLVMNLKPEIAIKLQKINGGDWNELMEKFIKLYEENLNKELEKEKPEQVKNTSRHIPQDIQNHVLKRSHGKCEFPSCNKNYDHLHHINRYASDKVHDPDQIVALCEAHHALAHRGLIDNEDGPRAKWKIAKDPDMTSLNWFIDRQVALYRRP